MVFSWYTKSQIDANYTAGQTAGRNDVTNSPNTYSLSQVQALNVGSPLLQRDGLGQFKLTVGIEKSPDLTTYSPFLMTAPEATINPDGKLEFIFTAPDNAAFYRLKAQ